MVQFEAEWQESVEPADHAAAYWLWHHGGEKAKQYIGALPSLPERKRRASQDTPDPTTQDEIADRFGVTRGALLAAKKRLQRRITNDGQD